MLEAFGVAGGFDLLGWVMGFLGLCLERSVDWFDRSEHQKPRLQKCRFVSKSYFEGAGAFVMLEIFGVWRS